MTNLLKLLGYAKKGVSFIGGLIGAYRIYIIIAGIVVGYFTIQHLRIKSKNKTIEKQTIEIKGLQFNIKEITSYNEIEHANTLKCLDDYSILSGALISAKGRNEQAVKNVKKLQADHNQKIKSIYENIKPATDCDNSYIDDDFINIMREN